MSNSFKKRSLDTNPIQPTLFRDLHLISQTYTYIHLCFSIVYCWLSKAAVIRFAMIPMSNSGQLASNKQYLGYANKLQERKPVQATAYCLIFEILITSFSVDSCFLLNKMTHIHMINRLPCCFFV